MHRQCVAYHYFISFALPVLDVRVRNDEVLHSVKVIQGFVVRLSLSLHAEVLTRVPVCVCVCV